MFFFSDFPDFFPGRVQISIPRGSPSERETESQGGFSRQTQSATRRMVPKYGHNRSLGHLQNRSLCNSKEPTGKTKFYSLNPADRPFCCGCPIIEVD